MRVALWYQTLDRSQTLYGTYASYEAAESGLNELFHNDDITEEGIFDVGYVELHT
jgi:hypothetical protein|tara:strand:+ start:633 stop:797 length:165 start_codon:yes stop_codon:yes gene_type:complete